MSVIKIFNATNAGQFSDWCNQYGLHLDIYYQTSFLEAEESLNHSSYEIFTFSNGSAVFIYPYLLKPLDNPFALYADISSPYGYAGPYCNDATIFAVAESEFLDYIKSKNVITEFVRYHYLYNEQSMFNANIDNQHNRTIVVLNTAQPSDNIWESEFSSTNRNLVRKLSNEQFEFTILNTLEPALFDTFINMYKLTMNNVNASQDYYFTKKYFYDLKDGLGEKLKLAIISKDDVIYSASLFFISAGILTYYLSARNLDFPKVPATNLLLSKMAFWANEHQINHFNLGGGLRNTEDDYLLKFKKNFSKSITPFFIGKRIHNTNVYAQLMDYYIEQKGLDNFNNNKHLLQFYRTI